MTTVPPRPPIAPGRGKRVDTRKYSWQSWAKGYLAWVLLLPVYLFLWGYAKAFGRLPAWLTKKLLLAHIRYTSTHEMDFRIPPDKTVPAYMHRWWRIARNAYMNIYYHIVLRSDDDRALHDHPWWSCSIVLEGGYFEHTIEAGGIHKRKWFGAGAITFRRAGKMAHRLELLQLDDRELPVTTIFITGPVLRRWGFHAEPGWVDAYDWDEYCLDQGLNGGMRMDGGSDAAVSDRNKHTNN